MRTRVALSVALTVSLLAVGWWFLAPAALGGRATYVVTHGVSMEPTFHTGDLAVVYPAVDYRPGQVAAYRSNLMHTVVLHRIVAKTAEGYDFKGDNNSWHDPEHPAEDQMIGRLGVRVPHGGVVLGWIHNPLVAGVLALVITTGGATGATGVRRRRRRRRAERAPMSIHDLQLASGSRWAHAAGLATVALLFGGLTAATYVFPGQSVEVQKVPWTTQVSYAYTAAVSPNLVYPDGEIHAGDPVYRKLVDRLTVRATWSLSTSAEHHIVGTARLWAIVQGPTGWTHRIALGPAQEIQDDRTSLTGTLNFHALDAVVVHAAGLTGIPVDKYTVSVQPLVALRGSLAGLRFDDAVRGPEPALALAITPSTVVPAITTGSAAAAANAATQPGQPTGTTGPSAQWARPTATKHSTAVSRPGTASWQVLGRHVPLMPLRWAGLLGTVLGLLALVVLLITKPDRTDPCAREARRYRSSIVPVTGLRLVPAGDVLDVTSMKSLAQIAQRFDRLILRPAATPGTFLVEDGTDLYRYQCNHPQHRPPHLDITSTAPGRHAQSSSRPEPLPKAL